MFLNLEAICIWNKSSTRNDLNSFFYSKTDRRNFKPLVGAQKRQKRVSQQLRPFVLRAASKYVTQFLRHAHTHENMLQFIQLVIELKSRARRLCATSRRIERSRPPNAKLIPVARFNLITHFAIRPRTRTMPHQILRPQLPRAARSTAKTEQRFLQKWDARIGDALSVIAEYLANWGRYAKGVYDVSYRERGIGQFYSKKFFGILTNKKVVRGATLRNVTPSGQSQISRKPWAIRENHL